MKTKAETIKILQKNSKKLGIIVPDFLYTEVKNFKKNKIFFLNQINKKFKYNPIIIRSSSKNEDTRKFTNAGKYDSIILKKYSDSDIIKSINSIIKKFKNSNDQIIIQNLIKNTKYTGVIFTRNINNLSNSNIKGDQNIEDSYFTFMDDKKKLLFLKKYLINKALFCVKSMRSHPFLENFQIHINHLPQNLHRLLETYLSPYYAKYSFFCFQFP